MKSTPQSPRSPAELVTQSIKSGPDMTEELAEGLSTDTARVPGVSPSTAGRSSSNGALQPLLHRTVDRRHQTVYSAYHPRIYEDLSPLQSLCTAPLFSGKRLSPGLIALPQILHTRVILFPLRSLSSHAASISSPSLYY